MLGSSVAKLIQNGAWTSAAPVKMLLPALALDSRKLIDTQNSSPWLAEEKWLVKHPYP